MYIHIVTLEVHMYMYIYGGVHTCTHTCTHACHEDIITWNWNYAICVN